MRDGKFETGIQFSRWETGNWEGKKFPSHHINSIDAFSYIFEITRNTKNFKLPHPFLFQFLRRKGQLSLLQEVHMMTIETTQQSTTARFIFPLIRPPLFNEDVISMFSGSSSTFFKTMFSRTPLWYHCLSHMSPISIFLTELLYLDFYSLDVKTFPRTKTLLKFKVLERTPRFLRMISFASLLNHARDGEASCDISLLGD